MGLSQQDLPDYRAQPTLLAVAQDPVLPDALRSAAAAIDARLIGPAGTADAADRLAEFVHVDAVVLALTHDEPDALDRLLVTLDAGAETGAYELIVLAPTSLIDLVVARAPAAQLLAEPDAADLADALAMVRLTVAGSLSDGSRDDKSSHLRELSEEVRRIAQRLAALSGAAEPAAADVASPSGEADAAMLRAAIRARRLREQFFPEDLFADPAWDILLDLTAARIEQRPVAVSSLCIAAAVPPTTALRHIKMMTEQKLLQRVADPQDGRRVFIELTESTAAAMNNYLAAMRRNGGPAV